MNINRYSCCLIFLLAAAQLIAQQNVTKLPGEFWWGGQTAQAVNMPFENGYTANLFEDQGGQVQTLLLSNKGRYIWREEPFSFSVDKYDIILSEEEGFVIGENGKSLASAYAYAAENFLVFASQAPSGALALPQYDLSVELPGQQDQASILAYANSIQEKGFPSGILVFGSEWQDDHGSFTFDGMKFPQPKRMIRDLKNLGFSVVLEVSAYVSPDSEVFRKLQASDAFLLDMMNPDRVKIVKWENGYSAMLDLSKSSSKLWMEGELNKLSNNLGIDGFKYADVNGEEMSEAISEGGTSPHQLSTTYTSIGLNSNLSIVGAGHKMGGYPIIRKLPPMELTWSALNSSIPALTLQGIMGYPYAQLDYVAAGANINELDQELIIRAIQLQALLPTMDASLVPYGQLDSLHQAVYLKAVQLRKDMSPVIKKLTNRAAANGTPIVQSMEFAYPNQGFVGLNDQFMLGSEYLVAPVLIQGQTKREVVLPKGTWLAPNGRAYKGPATSQFRVDLDEVLYFQKVKVDKTKS